MTDIQIKNAVEKFEALIREQSDRSDKKLLVILPEANKNVYLSARNIEGANVQTISGLNTYRVLNAGVVVLTESSLKAIDNILI